MNELDYRTAGDTGILIIFGREINEETLQRVMAFEKHIGDCDLPGIVEIQRSFCALRISYDPSEIDYGTLVSHLNALEQKLSNEKVSFQKSRVIEIPAVYGGEYGPDLTFVANHVNASEEEVIRRHLSSDYLVYVTGHIGGSAFYKGNDELFNLTRKKTPVIFYPAGAVLVANGMGCTLKAADGPTAWYALGRSPLRQWNPQKDPPTLINAGDCIRYRRINENEFHRIKREVDQDTYKLKYL